MIVLPLPPSVNELFVEARKGAYRGRAPSPQYARWKDAAGKALEAHEWPEVSPPYAVSISVNINHQGDIDNRIKAVLDLLVKHKVITGDQWINTLFVRRDRTIDGCTVHIENESGVSL